MATAFSNAIFVFFSGQPVAYIHPKLLVNLHNVTNSLIS
jgi:hypothetical protein